MKLIFAKYNSYAEIKSGSFNSTEKIYNKNELYFRTLKRIIKFAEYYNKIQDYIESGNLTELLIKYFPPDSNGKEFKTFPIEKFYEIVVEEYNKRFINLYYRDKYTKLTEIIKICQNLFIV